MEMQEWDGDRSSEERIDPVNLVTGFIVGTALTFVGVLAGWVLAGGGRERD
ncbi:MAG: hypothetical protein ACI364_05405 [Coriobacteriales bacterium]